MPIGRPSLRCTAVAVAGNVLSGVEVATITKSIEARSIPACRMAWIDAATARSEVFSPSAAKWRRVIPVRSRIHSSVVSTVLESSSLVTIRSGRYEPTPRTIERSMVNVQPTAAMGVLAFPPNTLVISSMIRSLAPARTNSTAAPMAWPNPTASVPPWLFTTTPFSPSSIAPL